MKRILVLLVVFCTMICFTSCSVSNETTNTSTTDTGRTVEEPEIKTTVAPTTPTPNTSYKTQQKSEPVVKEQTSTTVAVSNAIIVEDNHDNNVVYKKKCDSCGYVEPGTHSISPGSIIGGLYCPNCEETKRVELKTTYSY